MRQPVEVRKGRLIAFEGIDGTGKTTQVAMLGKWLRENGFEVVETREPTNGAYGRRIRQLYQARDSVSRQEELDLFIADRREHVEQLITPALAQGKIVLTDRYYLSTAAYQGVHGFDPQAIIAENESFAPVPDLVILIDIRPDEAVMRIRNYRQEALNNFEQEEGLRQVAAIFSSLDKEYIRRIDGNGSVDAVHRQVIARVGESGVLP